MDVAHGFPSCLEPGCASGQGWASRLGLRRRPAWREPCRPFFRLFFSAEEEKRTWSFVYSCLVADISFASLALAVLLPEPVTSEDG